MVAHINCCSLTVSTWPTQHQPLKSRVYFWVMCLFKAVLLKPETWSGCHPSLKRCSWIQSVRRFLFMPRSASQNNISVLVSELSTRAFHFHKGDSLLTGQDHHGDHNWSRSWFKFKLYNMTTSSPISSLVKWRHHATKKTLFTHKCRKQWREHAALKTESLLLLCLR